jgi:hypothetical protein
MLRHRILVAILIGLLWMTPSALIAAEARPWLCRDKPVFSDAKPMVCEISSRGAGRWRVFLMQFEAGTAHEGFEIVRSLDAMIAEPIKLPAGQYFVVAMHRTDGHWICPAPVQSTDAPGTVADFCFSAEEDGPCGVRLKVRREDGASPATSPAMPQ